MKRRWEYVDRIGRDYIYRVYWWELKWVKQFPFFAWHEVSGRVRGKNIWYWYPSGAECDLDMWHEGREEVRAREWKNDP